MQPGAHDHGRSAAHDIKALPAYAAGEVEVPWAIGTFHERVERETYWPEHSHPTHELIRTLSGVSKVSVGHRTWTITPALGLWVPAGVVHRGSAPAKTSYATTHFEIGVVDNAPPGPVALQITPLLRLLLERLEEPALSARARSLTEAMVIDLVEPSPHQLLVCLPTTPLLEPVVSALLADPGDPRSLEEWAADLGVSTRTVTRAFQADTGQGFAQWQAAVRMQRAAHRLAEGVRVIDVIDEVGYTSVSAFGAAFRRATGLSPREFRTGSPDVRAEDAVDRASG